MEQVPGSLAEMLPPRALHVPPGEQCGTGERGVPGLGSYTPSEAVPALGKGDPNPQLGGPWRSEAAAVHSAPPQGPCTFCELRGGLGGPGGQPKRRGLLCPSHSKMLWSRRQEATHTAAFRRRSRWGGAGPNLEAGLGMGVGKLVPFPIC